MANPANVFRVGDYVFVETNPSLPYQIRRIEELTKTSNGQVEAKVQSFYRKRDLSSTLAQQADKHLIQAEEEAEIEMGDNELEDVVRHQLSHREVFLTRQYENINANTIRGKCLVTLYNEAEEFPKYLDKEDWFCYFLVYDPQQKTLVADRGEMGIGSGYQANIPKSTINIKTDDRNLSDMETLVWTPDNTLTDREIDQFLVVARSVGTFARALDCSSSVKQPSLHMSAAAASRDVTLFHAMTNLHNNCYGLSKALSYLVPSGGPVLCRDEMEEWSSGEANLFEEALQKYGKDFNDIQKDFLPWKTLTSIVEYYYMWKTTDRYLQQKRLKAVSKECNLTQIYIPGLAPSNPAQPGKKQTSTIILTPPPGVTSNLVGATCEGCFGTTSQQWYPWSPNNSPHKLWLCTLCWIYWKKYGGLKRPDGFSGRGQDSMEPRYTCRVCGKVFNRAERLSSHMITHKSYKCVVRGCEKSFNSKPHLQRHLTGGHGYRPPSPRKLKPRSPFYMKSTSLTRISRRLCSDLIDLTHACRKPGGNMNIAEIKAQCLKRITDPKQTAILKAERKMKKRVLEKAVEYIRAHPQKPRKPSKPNLLPLHNTNAGQEKPSPPTSPGLSVTSPARKMMPPVKSYLSVQPATPKSSTWKYSAIPPAKMVTPSTNHMLSRKRSYEGSGIQQNGIDSPAPKRMSATSPLGKKGCECSYCGKILHNQGMKLESLSPQFECRSCRSRRLLRAVMKSDDLDSSLPSPEKLVQEEEKPIEEIRVLEVEPNAVTADCVRQSLEFNPETTKLNMTSTSCVEKSVNETTPLDLRQEPLNVGVATATKQIPQNFFDRRAKELSENLKVLEFQVEKAKCHLRAKRKAFDDLPYSNNRRGNTCGHCHKNGHNRVNCNSTLCRDVKLCRLKEKHPELMFEIRYLQRDLKELERKYGKYKNQHDAFVSSRQRAQLRFFTIMRPRLKSQNPDKYIDASALEGDLMILQRALKDKVPLEKSHDWKLPSIIEEYRHCL